MDPIKMLCALRDDAPLHVLAKEIGCSKAYLSYVLNGHRAPGPKVLAYLGLERVQSTVYRKRRG
jgi:hypothetical protein